MKLLKRTESACTFLVGKRERELLSAVLRHYPMVIAGHFSSRRPGHEPVEQSEALLQEALAEQQKENRRQVEEMLNEPGRFREHDLGFTFRLTPSEIEWLLQVLNDVRVGSWIQLGEPDTSSRSALQEMKLDEHTVQLAWRMELAGLFQGALLAGINSAGEDPARE